MGSVAEVYDHPLAGARARQRTGVAVAAGGSITSRLFTAYDGNDPNHNRLNAIPVDNLTLIDADIDLSVKQLTLRHDGEEILSLPVSYAKTGDTFITEFRQRTPAIDTGDDTAAKLEEFTGYKGIRLAQKLLSWQHGIGRNPATDKLAPIHVVTKQSLAYLDGDWRAIGHEAPIDELDRRPRADFILDMPELEPLEDIKINRLRLGDLTLTRTVKGATERCLIPGIHPRTGERLAGWRKVYRSLPKSEADKPVFGIYLAPELATNETTQVWRGAEAEVLSVV